MDAQKLLDEAKLLFQNFGWFSIVLVLATTLLMIPLNMLYKKIMKNEKIERLRKTISCVSVYLIAMALVAILTAIVRKPMSFAYLVGGATSCGFLSMVLWAIIKLLRDYGWRPFVKKLATSKEAKKWLKDLGISEGLLDLVNSKLDNFIKEHNIVSLDDYVRNEINMASQIRTQLNGFVANDKINDLVNSILQPVKQKLK